MPLLGIVLALALVGLFTLKRVSYAALAIALAILYVAATPGDAVTRYLCTTVPAYLVLAQLAERSRLLEDDRAGVLRRGDDDPHRFARQWLPDHLTVLARKRVSGRRLRRESLRTHLSLKTPPAFPDPRPGWSRP